MKEEGTPFDGLGQQFGTAEGHPQPQQDEQGQKQGGQEGGAQPTGGAEKEQGQQGDERGEAAVAGDEVVGQDGQQPLSRGVDDTAAHDTGGVAAESHTDGQGLLSTGTALLEGFIQIVRHPRQIAHILQ